MKKSEVFKTLLATDNTAPRALHAALNMDFEKPFYIFAVPARFTAKQILKETTAAGYTPGGAVIAILTQPARTNCFCDSLFLATLDASERFKIDYQRAIPYTIGAKRTKVDDYFGRGDFESIRKNNTQSFVICQKRGDLATENPHPVDLSARFKVENIRKWCYQSGGVDYIGEIETRRTDDNGSRYTYNKRGRVIVKGRDEYREITELIDKSGYVVNLKRDELKRRAAALRAERKKTAYTETSNAAEIATIRAKFEAKKAAIIEELTAAKTAEEFKAAVDKAWSYKGIAGIFGDLERLEARDAAKQYNSIEDYKRAAEGITAAIDAI